MNVAEAYIKYKKQLIIIISGLSGCGKSMLAQDISSDFKIPIIKQREFYKKDYDLKVDLHNGKTVINWHTDDSIDWDLLNERIESDKGKGLILTGLAFPPDKLKFKTDYHFHVSLSKQNCLERRKKIIEEKKDKYPEAYEEIEDGTAKLVMNKLIFPYYLETLKNGVINKFLNGNKLSRSEMYDTAFDILISIIEKYLYKDMKQSKNVQRQSTNEYSSMNIPKNDTNNNTDNNTDISSTSSPITQSTDPLENVVHDDKDDTSSYEIEDSNEMGAEAGTHVVEQSVGFSYV
jgi:adenylate kinase family enzyme